MPPEETNPTSVGELMKKEKKTALIRVESNDSRLVSHIPADIQKKLANEMGYMQKGMAPVLTKNGKPLFRKGKIVLALQNKLKTKYNYMTGAFPTGMLDRCKKLLKGYGYKIKLLDNRPKLAVSEENILERMNTFPLTLRPYQIEAVSKGIYNPLMTFHMATGAGKTVVFAAIAHATQLKTLIIVGRGDLLEQHYKSFIKYFGEEEVGIIQQKTLEFDKPICIATVQTLMSQLKRHRYQVDKYLKSIEYVIMDECHHAQSNTWRRIPKLCTNAYLKHGFSGTPWDFSSANVELETVCGAIKTKVTASHLIKLGYLAKPTITFHRYRGHEDAVQGENFTEVYTRGIVENPKRNRAICDVVMGEYKTGAKILLVVQRIKHGEILAQRLRKLGIHDREIGYLHGSKGKVIRQHGRKEFEQGDIQIMIVSNIWNEGIDIPSVDVLVKADSYGGGDIYESEGVRNLIQQIGRVLRKPVPKGASDVNIEKEHTVRIHDFGDKHHRFLENWTRNRLRTVKMEPEFDVQIR